MGTLARRYAPLVALAVLQLLVIGLVPSKPAGRQAVRVTPGKVVETGPSGTQGPAAADVTAGPSGPGADRGATPSGTGGRAAAAVPAPATAGDTSRCVNGRGFDPAIAYWAPPCVPGTPGGPYGDNGGATYRGVDHDTITLVDYVTNYGAEVNAVLKVQGRLVTYDDAVVLDRAWERFVNDHYVLYGRRVKIVPYQGKCQSVPPDYACLIAEMGSVVNTYQPFAVMWQTNLCSACYAELARLEVVALGGAGFSDDLADQLAPYFWSARESATDIEQAFAGWWCAQMSSKNVPSRRVRHAGRQNPAQDLNGKPRELGIVTSDDPDKKQTVQRFLVPLLERTCGERVTHLYFYAQDTTTGARQAAASMAAMNTLTNPATSVLCLCQPAAAAAWYSGEQSNSYYPENLIATDMDMDLDATGQSYGPDHGGPSIACPSPPAGCPHDLVLGLGAEGPQEPQGDDAGRRIFAAGGGDELPGSVTPVLATTIAREWIMLANLLEAAGPDLTPTAMAARAPSIGQLGGAPGSDPLLTFARNPHGSGYWAQDARLVYWDRGRPSPYNGKPGTYVQVGPRVLPDGWVPKPDGPDVPVRRS